MGSRANKPTSRGPEYEPRFDTSNRAVRNKPGPASDAVRKEMLKRQQAEAAAEAQKRRAASEASKKPSRAPLGARAAQSDNDENPTADITARRAGVRLSGRGRQLDRQEKAILGKD